MRRFPFLEIIIFGISYVLHMMKERLVTYVTSLISTDVKIPFIGGAINAVTGAAGKVAGTSLNAILFPIEIIYQVAKIIVIVRLIIWLLLLIIGIIMKIMKRLKRKKKDKAQKQNQAEAVEESAAREQIPGRRKMTSWD